VTAAYDALAPHYRDYSRDKSVYLQAVDDVILQNLPPRPIRVLDVGAGDGVRGLSLARKMEAERIILAEPSPEMVKLCRAAGAEVWQCTAQELPDSEGQFDVILSLWNVLGHVPTPAARIDALSRMSKLLAPAGRMFIDVNNRHNAAAYGRWRVMLRRLIDAIKPNHERGDVSFEWRVNGDVVPAMGHLFTPTEMAELLHCSGLQIIRRMTVDYITGQIAESPFKGQLVFILERQP
jgi:SAM-dependent methyltransferase